jgi:hypothetical protein
MRALLPLLAVAALLLGPAESAAQPAGGGEPIYDELRRTALNIRPADIGIEVRGSQPIVYGIVMDMDVDGHTATLVSFSAGDTSLYLSSGGGTIGGSADPGVAAASRDFVAAARPHLAAMAAAPRQPLPGRGQTSFYLITTAGVRGSTRPTEALVEGTDALAPLFMAGQRVLHLILQAGRRDRPGKRGQSQ